MRHDSVVSRYAIPIGISQVDGWSTGPSGFGESQHMPCVYVIGGSIQTTLPRSS